MLEQACDSCSRGLDSLAMEGTHKLNVRQKAQLSYALAGLMKLLIDIQK